MRVVVADDSVPLREGLARILEEGEFEICRPRADGASRRQLATSSTEGLCGIRDLPFAAQGSVY